VTVHSDDFYESLAVRWLKSRIDPDDDDLEPSEYFWDLSNWEDVESYRKATLAVSTQALKVRGGTASFGVGLLEQYLNSPECRADLAWLFERSPEGVLASLPWVDANHLCSNEDAAEGFVDFCVAHSVSPMTPVRFWNESDQLAFIERLADPVRSRVFPGLEEGIDFDADFLKDIPLTRRADLFGDRSG
jgi:hypothetical protein